MNEFPIHYTGQYYQDEKYGWGEESFGYSTQPYKIYTGKFEHDKKSGLGSTVWTLFTQRYHQGWYRDNLPNGSGEIHLKPNYFVMTNFVDGVPDGLSNGVDYSGNSWSGGHIINNLISGKTKITYKDGSTFQGILMDNIANGYGELNFSNGDLYFGRFKYGMFDDDRSADYVHKDSEIGQY